MLYVIGREAANRVSLRKPFKGRPRGLEGTSYGKSRESLFKAQYKKPEAGKRLVLSRENKSLVGLTE